MQARLKYDRNDFSEILERFRPASPAASSYCKQPSSRISLTDYAAMRKKKRKYVNQGKIDDFQLDEQQLDGSQLDVSDLGHV